MVCRTFCAISKPSMRICRLARDQKQRPQPMDSWAGRYRQARILRHLLEAPEAGCHTEICLVVHNTLGYAVDRLARRLKAICATFRAGSPPSKRWPCAASPLRSRRAWRDVPQAAKPGPVILLRGIAHFATACAEFPSPVEPIAAAVADGAHSRSEIWCRIPLPACRTPSWIRCPITRLKLGTRLSDAWRSLIRTHCFRKRDQLKFPQALMNREIAFKLLPLPRAVLQAAAAC
jgi:hypothetical protein